MKIDTWMVTAFGIIVAAAVAVIVNYQNRKQSRQIELFRKDPSVGLIPPPHPWIRFLQKNWFHLAYLTGMVYYFYRWMREDLQGSYRVGVSAAMFVLYFVLYFVSYFLSRGFQVSRGMTDVIDWISEDTNKAIKVLSAHNKMLLAIVRDLELRGLLSEDVKAQIETANGELRSVNESIKPR